MNTKKFLLSLAKYAGGTFILLFVILVAHIALAKPIAYDNATMQISRIDFAAPVDDQLAKQLKIDLKSINGIMSQKLNPETGTLVFFHDNRIVDGQKVYDELMRKGYYEAKRFTVSEETAKKKVCPAMPKDGIAYRFSSGIQKIFNH